MQNMTEFAKRRKQLLQKIGPKGIAILASSETQKRNGDYDYPFRQQSDFLYFTHFAEPESVALFCPKRKEGEYILFTRPRDRAHEIWEGRRAGLEGAKKQFGADESFSIADLAQKLPEILAGREKIYYTLGLNTSFDKILLQAVNDVRTKIRSGLPAPHSFIDINEIAHEMRLIKSPAEIAIMRKAASISARAHIIAMEKCKPGMFEYELEAELLYEFNRHGARFPAYTSIVGQGANSCILHYNENNQRIQNDSIVLIDAGAEYEYYAADITRTFPANGKFSKEQAAIYEIVLASQIAGIEAIKPGAPWDKVENKVVSVITQGLLDLGLLKGELKELIETKAYFPFYMHRSGHWLGLDVHDVGRYKVNDEWRTLKPGMVRTVEPGIYISADIPKIPKKWHNIGVRIEDDILVTAKGYENLSDEAPKTIADIEKLMS